MTRVLKIVAVALMTAGALGSVAACSSSSTSSTASSTTTTADSSSKTFEVTTDDGQISVSLEGDLPTGWPTSFPLQQDAVPAGSGSVANSSSGKQVAVFTTSSSPQDTFTFYKESPDLTVSSSKSVGIGSAFVGTVAFTGTYTGRVTILSKGGTTMIIVVLDAPTAGTSGSTGTTSTTAAY